MKITATMRKVLRLLLLGRRLLWYGDNGPQMVGCPFWPQKRTVRAMLKGGLLVWAPKTLECDWGIRELMRPCRECRAPTDTSDRLCLDCWLGVDLDNKAPSAGQASEEVPSV